MPGSLSRLADKAEKENDAKTMAFVAMRLPVGSARGRKLAEKAVALDPRLTWIYYVMIESDRVSPESELLPRLQQWDPDNGVVYVMQAERLPGMPRRGAMVKLPPEGEQLRPWRELTQKALMAPKFDTYVKQRFELEREVTRKQGWPQPIAIVSALMSHPMAQWAHLTTYARLTMHETHPSSSEDIDAATAVWKFGSGLEGRAVTDVDKVMALQMEQAGLSRLQELSVGSHREAEFLNVALQRVRVARTRFSTLDNRAPDANQWTATLVNLSALLSLIALVWILAGAIYARTVRRLGVRGRLFLLSALRFAPVLLLVSAIALLASYHPYAAMFSYFMTHPAPPTFEPLMNLDALAVVPGIVLALYALPQVNSLLWLTVIVVGLVICALLVQRMLRPPKTIAAAAR